MAVTIVGEARKFIVRLLPSFRDLKLLSRDVTPCHLREDNPYRLNEVRIASYESTYIPRNSIRHTIGTLLCVLAFPLRRRVHEDTLEPMRRDVPAQCKVRKHSPRRRLQRPQEPLLSCRAPLLLEFVLIRGCKERVPIDYPEMIGQLTATHTLDDNPAARACCAKSATRVWGHNRSSDIAYAPIPMTYHILVRAIRARANQARRYFVLPAVFLHK
jgi:hypothetical protein